MKRFIFILPSDLTGGAEANLLKLVRHLSKRGDMVYVLFLSCHNLEVGSIWEKMDNVNYLYSPTKRESLGCFWLMWIILFERKFSGMTFDCSFSSHVHCNALISTLKRFHFLKIKRLVLRESTNIFSWFKGLKLRLISLLYKLYDRRACLVCQTQRMKDELVSNIPEFCSMDVRVVKNPIDTQFLSERKVNTCKVVENLLPTLNNSKIILAVGRLVKEKAYDILIDALAILDKECQLLIVGEGPERINLENQVRSKGLEGRVHFVGGLINPYPLMAHCHLGVISSRLEGFPNVLLEQMFLAPKVVSTLCAAGVESIPGILTCETESSIALSRVINAALVQEQECARKNKVLMLQYVDKLSVESFFNKIS
ncbi:glycosyltransferase [Vibrio coralliilyticus]|uniref:Glycosyltransferase n=1 Tax=Vibrio coralliilyticus TaxID=190893 RepID=A0AAP7DDK3_9VIBR|nr:glycosyltransferase [Vibrio coralliilyticus]NOJ23994.1 glycosyltransferase [Vibrio coralliilyticus]